MKIRVACVLVSVSVLGAASCGIDTAEKSSISTLVPVVGIALDRSFQPNKGLVLNLDENGWPVRAGASMDEPVKESRRFYDTLKAPNYEPVMVDYPDPDTGAPPSIKMTAPITFKDWLRAFQFQEPNPGETKEQFRRRTDVVVYYNKNELGLGRELGCSEFDDGVDRNGTPLKGVACYVTNFGTAFRDVVNSLPIAIEGVHAKNTVCISWRPSMPANYQVQFYTYNGDGDRREWAQLDTLGPRPLPQVCMNCHGGSYDNTTHLAKYARFLPLDPNVVVFAAAGTPGGVSREEQEERIRKLNLLSTKSPLTDAQNIMLDQLYGGKMDVAGTVSAKEWAPPKWNDTTEHRALFDKVLKPNCTTCHAAMETGPGGNKLAIASLFESPALLEGGLEAQLCNAFTMPNSQATRLNFWEPDKLTFTDNQEYGSAAELLLSQLGMGGASQCHNLESWASCNRGSDPDELCGNKYSGRACDRQTGKCVPNLKDPRNPGEPNGLCKMDGSRGCPYPQECRATGKAPSPATPGFDGLCIP